MTEMTDMTLEADVTVSVIVPFFQAERYLPDALDSILGQTHPGIELIMIDDGSTDGGPDLARRRVPPAVLISRSHRGIGATRNAGIAAASAPLLAFCDADDLWEPTKLERQVDLLRRHPELAGTFCAVQEFLSPDLPVEAATSREPRLIRSGVGVSALVIRREALADIGPFDETLRVGDWFEYYGRLQRSGHRFGIVDEVLVRRRLHATNNSLQQADSRREYLKMLQGHLRTRRSATDPDPVP